VHVRADANVAPLHTPHDGLSACEPQSTEEREHRGAVGSGERRRVDLRHLLRVGTDARHDDTADAALPAEQHRCDGSLRDGQIPFEP
jgi:hypothetical protein